MADIGATLRETRMRAKIDINEVEARTKIRAKYLRAIENEEWDLLPGEVYVKTFVRTYAEFLGLDSRQLLDELRRRYDGGPDHEPRPISARARERDRGRERAPRGPLVPPWALVGAVLVIVLALLWIVGNNNGTKKQATGVATGARSRTTQHRAPARHQSQSAAARTVPSKPTTVRLQLVPTGRVYVCLVDGHGRQLIPGQIFDVGQTIPTEHSSKLLLTLGNASVQMKVNGKTVPVTPSPTSIGFELLPGVTHSLPVSQQPRCA